MSPDREPGSGRVVRRRGRRRLILIGVILGALAAGSIGWSTRLDDPPRYDGAGYALLGLALSQGRGYRDIADPDGPPHAHFPPGYPAALGLLWTVQGRASVPSAHLFSVGCSLVAIGATWRWWLGTEPRVVAILLGLALAINWGWGRAGGSIQSEPLFLAGSAIALVLASRRGGVRTGLALGAVLGLCVLTRHVGACLAVAVGVDLWLRGRRGQVGWAFLVLAGMVGPWVGWQTWVGSGSQAGLFRVGSIPGVVASQVIFYVQRIPDAVVGPFVEAATVFGRSRVVAWLAGGWAVGASSVIVLGWGRMLGSPSRRLGALIPISTLGLLLVWPFTEAGRFLVPLVPFLLMGAVEGTALILRAVRVRRARTWAAGLVLAASIPYSVYAIVSDRASAQRRTHEDFEAACHWIAGQSDHPGPVLARHPGDVFWLTGRTALTIPEGDAIGQTIDRYYVAYLLVDEDRYVNAPANPLRAYLASPTGRARLVWKGRGVVEVFEVARPGD